MNQPPLEMGLSRKATPSCFQIYTGDTSCFIFMYIFSSLECVGHYFAYVAHFVLLRDVCVRTQRAAVANRRAINLATHLPNLATHLPDLATHLP